MLSREELVVKLDEHKKMMQCVKEVLRGEDGRSGTRKLLDLQLKMNSMKDEEAEDAMNNFSDVLAGVADDSIIIIFDVCGKCKIVEEFTGLDVDFKHILSSMEKSTSALGK